MGMNPIAQSGRQGYKVNQYVLDDVSDIADLPTSCAPGSTARVIATGDMYIMNSGKQWIKQPTSGGASGPSSIQIINL